MKRTTLTASLVGSAAAGLIAAAIATPAWAQATTYPEGTDCSAIQNSASQQDCMQQLNESRQNPISGDQGESVTTPGSNVPPSAADPGAATNANPNGTSSGATPAAPVQATPGGTNAAPGGTTGGTTTTTP